MVSVRKRQPVLLGKRGEAILQAIYVYRYMTARDVCHLLYSPSSLVHVRKILTELAGGGDYVENEYLYRFALQKAGAGNRVRVYTLGSRGRDFCKTELEYPVAWYFRPEKIRHLSFAHLLHNLMLTRVLVAAREWAKDRTDVKLLNVWTSYELGTMIPGVELMKEGKPEKVPVIPDAWLLFEVREDGEWFASPVLLEVDRGTTYKRKFQERIAARIEFIREGGVYAQVFGRREVMIAYVTTGETEGFRETRRRAMCDWTQEVLKQQKKESWASVFRFCSVAYEEIYEAGLFERRMWFRPDEERPGMLFEG